MTHPYNPKCACPECVSTRHAKCQASRPQPVVAACSVGSPTDALADRKALIEEIDVAIQELLSRKEVVEAEIEVLEGRM
jgi:hypothetical protein